MRADVRRFPVIVGPTAGGKTTLAVEVALRLSGLASDAISCDEPGAEIISADSVQIFRGMDIGSGKATAAERRGIPHHLIDIVEPTAAFTVHDWLASAERAIADVRSRGRVPIVVGGTHLYVKSLLEGMFEGPGADEALRAELRAMGPAALRAELERVDPAAAGRIHPNDERRTVRALEVYRLTGTPISEHQAQWDREQGARTDAVLVRLNWPSELINPRINARVKAMMAGGLLEEVRAFWSAGMLGVQAVEALGYRQLVDHFEGRCTLEEAVETIKIETRRFAKNQRTWLRRLGAPEGSLSIDAASTPAGGWSELVIRAICS
jgi:tRNA dimethylallyltransferase